MSGGATFSVEPNDRIAFRIPYVSDDVLVVEKPARVPTQPGKGHQSDTILNALFATYGKQLQKLGKARDFGLLHRLDKDTSGVLIVALTQGAYDKLREDFAERRIKKFYWAICDRAPKVPQGVVKLAIVESGLGGNTGASSPKTAHVARVGKPAVTAYRTLATSEACSLVEARPVTGRLHQVRVHLDAIGCAILGDEFYGPRRVKGAAARLMLHAHRIVFTHPITGETVDVRTQMPREMKKVMKLVGLKMQESETKAEE
jgi:23S rRNA pseudouridine1911/1915/1917 synthase